ncbi:MAG: 1-deoxy-D-xylulose-5-phosphate reductoisomerase [Deltaproteobacteria bacterium]|nr:1-deoxy-D-xylulose-5-phosphate reductoisomerase [Deltaproteobacteria bacterium]
MARVTKLSILGSTGSIGRSTLDLVRLHPERFDVVALAAGANINLLREQIEEFLPKVVSVQREEDRKKLQASLSASVECLSGEEGALAVGGFDEATIVVSAIVGAAGLRPTLAAIEAGKDVALANKETLVMAGSLVMGEVERRGTRLLPVDSEHSAIFQAMSGQRREDVRRLILTASGGPFLNMEPGRVGHVTPEEALAHPNWKMGRKVSIDSATLMNKGLEVIEGRWLFDMGYDKIDVVIHPQSIVHSMVEYVDGSVIAQLGTADMKGPIAYALSYPERIEAGVAPLDLTAWGRLDFMEPDRATFPCLGLAYSALKEGGTMSAVLNGTDEVAVEAFLEGAIPFSGIHEVVERVMDVHRCEDETDLEAILEADRWARETAWQTIREGAAHR